MLALFTIFVSSFVIALSGALMPGPLLTATVSESSRRGPVAGPLLVVGHGVLELLLLTALLLGLAPYLTHDVVFVAVAVGGAFILGWMALTMLRTLPSLSLRWEAEAASRGDLVGRGALLSLANPYWLVWWATIGLAYVLYCREHAGLAGIVVFFVGHILADLAWYAAVASAVGKGRRFFTDRLYRALMGSCAVLLLVFAAIFLYAGIDRAFSRQSDTPPPLSRLPSARGRRAWRAALRPAPADGKKAMASPRFFLRLD